MWFEKNEYPDHLLSIVRYGLPTPAYQKLIKEIAERARLPLWFIGDLDPFDLTTFVALRCGDPDLRRPERQVLPISFCGIDDGWLRLCEQHLLPKWSGALPIIRMSRIELEHRDLILQLAPWLVEEVGARCAELLRSGLKIELEGASNPRLYKKEFSGALLKHLTKRARQRAPGT